MQKNDIVLFYNQGSSCSPFPPPGLPAPPVSQVSAVTRGFPVTTGHRFPSGGGAAFLGRHAVAHTVEVGGWRSAGDLAARGEGKRSPRDTSSGAAGGWVCGGKTRPPPLPPEPCGPLLCRFAARTRAPDCSGPRAAAAWAGSGSGWGGVRERPLSLQSGLSHPRRSAENTRRPVPGQGVLLPRACPLVPPSPPHPSMCPPWLPVRSPSFGSGTFCLEPLAPGQAPRETRWGVLVTSPCPRGG